MATPDELLAELRGLAASVSREVEGALRGDILDLRRELLEGQQRLTEVLLAKPCIVVDDGKCPHCGEQR